MHHVVLLGDSIFDNAAYVPGKSPVITQLRERLGANGEATLLAVDGDMVGNIVEQLARLPEGATHLVVSAGGNDALTCLDLSSDKVSTIGEAVLALAEIRQLFNDRYAAMLDAVTARGLPAAVCTIYHPRFPEPEVQKFAVAGLSIFNDVILLQAISRGLPVIDLRHVCNDDADFANPIEPSDIGGAKIVETVLHVVEGRAQDSHRTVVFSGI